jgi:hypothetical protein
MNVFTRILELVGIFQNRAKVVNTFNEMKAGFQVSGARFAALALRTAQFLRFSFLTPEH